jgi:chromosome partitioning protein
VAATIACANQKGGVGKTTTVVNLGAYLALSGRTVLLVDFDPQGNATSGLGVDKGAVRRSVYDVLAGTAAVTDLVRPTRIGGLSLLPASIALAGAEVELAPLEEREHRLAAALAPIVEAYDDILIDCPPSLGLLTVNALAAADAVLIPLQCEYFALEGLSQLISTINLVRDNLNPRLAIAGVVLTMFDARTNLSAEVRDEARRHLDGTVFDAVIPRSVRLSEAPSYGLPIALYSGESRGAIAYRELAAEFVSRAERAGARLHEPVLVADDVPR